MSKKLLPLLLVVLVVLVTVVYLMRSDTPFTSDDSTLEDSTVQSEPYEPQIDPADFSTEITNPYLTYTQGTTMIFEGETDEGLERIEVTVTNETRTVMGVETIVVRDTVYLDGEMIEDTKDWYAQDSEGNVWYFGEETAEYEDGEIVSTEGAWEAGVDGAQPGIVMQADPQVGQEYRQEYYVGKAEDMGTVEALDESVDVPYGGEHDGCLKTRDWTPLEEGIDEYKFYCPDVGGLTLEIGIYSGERIQLIEVRRAESDDFIAG